MRGLFIGRFQPFHMGHLYAIKKILSECDDVIVVVGSAEKNHTLENPFTCGERLEMLDRVLKKEGLKEKCLFSHLQDTGRDRHSTWYGLLETYCPRFDVAYSNNPLVKLLLEERGHEVREMKMLKRSEYQASKIRELILRGGDWKKLVPKVVADFIRENGLGERLRNLRKLE